LVRVDRGAAIVADGGAEIDLEGGTEIDTGGVEIPAAGEAAIDTDEAGHFRMIGEGATQGIQEAVAKAIRDIVETTQGVIRLRGRGPPDVVEDRILLGTAGGLGVPGQ